ncbi:AAA family ATPase, partial [Salmonella enterica]|nr:AAA family ATPase [Salmonella enterica]
MFIETIFLKGFRNFANARINFKKSSLIIGANDVGKTNLLYALRLLLDKSLSELELEPKSNDFHITETGEQHENLEIVIQFAEVIEDAIVSRIGGYISEDQETYIKYQASLAN